MPAGRPFPMTPQPLRSRGVAWLATTLLAGMSLGVPVVAQAPSAQTADDLYRTGCRLLDAGEAKAAIEPLSNAVARRPDVPRYALRLAAALEADGREEEAASLLDLLRRKFADDDDVCIASARRFVARGDFREARLLLDPRRDRLSAEATLLWIRCIRETAGAMEADRVTSLALRRFPADASVWLESVESALRLRQFATVLRRVDDARAVLGRDPRLDALTAEAHFELGNLLGQTVVRSAPGGQPGQVRDGWLLLERRAPPDRFLCCPSQSALGAIRRALDAGLDTPHAHLLHARILHRANRPTEGFAVLQQREALLLESGGIDALHTLRELAIAAGELSDYLRYSQRLAQRLPERRERILGDAYLAVAEVYNQRGDEALYREFLRRALEHTSGDAALLLRLADCDWDAGRRTEAATLYRHVLDAAPAHPDRLRILERLAE